MSQIKKTRGQIISGEKYDFEKYTKGLGEFYFENAEQNGANIFQIDARTGLKETYASVKERSTRLAINLRKLGATSDDLIMTCSQNSMDCCIPHIAALFLGAKTANLHHLQSIRDWTHCMNVVRPSFVFVQESCLGNMEKCLDSLEKKPELIVFGKSEKYKTLDDLLVFCEEEISFLPFVVKNCHETAVVTFSSGTTGPPKAMCLSHYALINKIISNRSSFPEGAVGLVYSTLFWISAVIQILVCFYTKGVKLVPPPEFNPQEMLELIEKYHINYMFVNPSLLRPISQLEELTNYDTSSLKFIVTIGTALSPSENLSLRKVFKSVVLTQAYGCSETVSDGTAFNPVKHKELTSRLNSVGKCTSNCQIKVVDPENNLLGSNEVGEIYIKSPFRINGYYNRDSDEGYDEDGFFKTGDMGYYDEDECFYLVGRFKEMFKYKTFQIAPKYLETILLENPDIVQAGVFGIPNEIDGYHPAACVVLKDGVNTTVEEIESLYSKNVSHWQKLRGGIKIVESLPMTPTMKLQRNKLLQLFLST